MPTCRALVLFALVTALAVAAEPAAPDPAAVRAAAVALVDRLTAGEFAAASKAFTAGGPSADRLRDQWQAAVKEAGAFRARAAGDVHVRGTGVIATVRCAFADK